jgi:GTPase SAR1 family protein
MKIAFIGSHGVGKTTLCFDLAARLKHLDFAVDIVKEVARSCPLPINQETTLEAQAWILHTQMAHEIIAGAQFEVVVCDRSVLDNYAYLVHQIGRQPAYDALVCSWVKTYSALFKVPVLQAPSFDGTRAVSGAFQTEIDAVIDDLVDALEVRCYYLDPAGRSAWVDTVLRTTGLPLRPPQIDLFASATPTPRQSG